MTITNSSQIVICDYKPDDSDCQLFEHIRELVRGNPGQFKEAGAWLDEDYSNRVFTEKEAGEKRNEYRKWGLRGRLDALQKAADFIRRPSDFNNSYRGDLPHDYTRAAARKFKLPYPHPKRKCNPEIFDSEGQRTYPNIQRFLEALFDIMGPPVNDERDWSLASKRNEKRQRQARRIILLTWLIVDPDADPFEPTLCELQRVEWDADSNAPEASVEYAIFSAYEIFGWEENQNREIWRAIVFSKGTGFWIEGDEKPRWLKRAHDAWDAVDGDKLLEKYTTPAGSKQNRNSKNSKKRNKQGKGKAGRKKIPPAETADRWAFYNTVRERKDENDAPLKVVAEDEGKSFQEASAL